MCVFCVIAYSTAHAYVTYASVPAAAKACESAKLNPIELDGRKLIVMKYTEPPMRMPPGNCYYADWDSVV